MEKLTLGDLVSLNKAICEKTGEPFHILNEDSLLSALSIQDNNYYDNDDMMLCALLRSLIICHGFEQGNKRTAFLAIALLKLPLCSSEKFAEVILKIADSRIKTIEDIYDLLYKDNQTTKDAESEDSAL